MDIERLKNDPDYWNDVAPDEATHCNPDPNSDFRWYNEEKQSAMDREGGRWMDSQSSDFYWASLIPRPASKPWSGPEDGLPPVGAAVEYFHDSGFADIHPFTKWVDGDEVEIIAHKRVSGDLIPVVFNIRHETATAVVPSCLRPIRTEKERVVDAAMKQWIGSNINTLEWRAREDFLGAAYDAGFLKMPEEP